MVSLNGENSADGSGTLHGRASHVSVDTVFQDTWLLVLDIRNGRPVTIDLALFKLCCQRVEAARALLSALPQNLVDELLFAQCALLDEAVKTMPDTDVSVWYSQPLQSRFFDRIDAGEAIFERIRRLLHDATPCPELVCMYHRLLLLGFRGKYRGGNGGECQELRRSLEVLLDEPKAAVSTREVAVLTGNQGNAYWRSPWAVLASLVILTALVWVGLRMFLFSQLAG